MIKKASIVQPEFFELPKKIQRDADDLHYMREFVKWGEEICFDNETHHIEFSLKRRECPTCWKSLLQAGEGK